MALGKIHKWLTSCLDSHNECRETLAGELCSKDNLLPTRLIDVTATPPRLIETSTLPKTTGQYLCLSYCWGSLSDSSEYCKLTRASLTKFTVALPFDALPKTIQDGMLITRSLGQRYLWVDSLCIIQDDEAMGDWHTEASKMCQIYENALCTIAATAAAHSGEGLFFPRQADDGGPNSRSDKQARFSCSVNGSRLGDFFISTPAVGYSETYDGEIESSRWSTRAWVFQEQVCSRRILHFGKHQMFWECLECTRQEDGTVVKSMNERRWKADMRYGIRRSSAHRARIIAATNYSLTKSLPWHSRGIDYVLEWNEIINLYNARSITRKYDRLAAIDGIAQEISRWSGYKYCYGLWLQDIARGLFWIPSQNLLARPSNATGA